MPFCPHCKKHYNEEENCCPICEHPEDCECGLEFEPDEDKDDYYDDGKDDYYDEE